VRPIIFPVIVAAAVAGIAGRADAQGRGDRAIFGGGVGSAEQLVTIRSSIGGTFHDPIGRTSGATFEQRITERTWFGNASNILTYRYDRPFLNARAAGGALSNYLPSGTPDRKWSNQYTTDAQVSTGHTFLLSPRTVFSLGQSATFRPAYVGATVPGALSFGGNDFTDPSLFLPPQITSIDGHVLGSSSNATLRRELTRRVSFESSYWFDRTWNFDSAQDFNHRAHRASAAVLVSLTRHLRLRTGYRFTDTRATAPGSPRFRESAADIGVDYNRGGSLRLTRRTTLALGGGASGIADSERRQHYFVLGHAQLIHEIGRTWRSSAGYRRHLDFSSLFMEPILADTASAEIGGLITRSLSFQGGAGYSHGRVGFTGPGNGLTRASALAQLQTAISRYLALGVNYTYYRHSVGDAVLIRPELAGRVEGQSLRVFLSAWAPLFHRARRPNAPE
jgi:hypothetical protein